MTFSTKIEVLSAIAAKEITAEEGALALVELAKPKAPRTQADVLADLANGTLTPEDAEVELAEIEQRDIDAALAAAKPTRKHGGGGKRADTVLGYSATAVVRWMGAQGFGFKDVRTAITALCPNNGLSDSTIRCQLFGSKFAKGEKGYRGEPAPITDDEACVIDNAVCGYEAYDVQEPETCMSNDSLANALMV